jgi:hypothetical protein
MTRPVGVIAVRRHAARVRRAVQASAAVVVVLVVVAVVAFFRPSAGDTGDLLPRLPRIDAPRVVDTSDVGDPFVLTVRDAPGAPKGTTTYLRFGTTDWRSNVPEATSSDLVHWQQVPDAFPVLPGWAAPSVSMTWAPAVIGAGGRYVLYVATKEEASGHQCIAVATSPRPEGPFAAQTAGPFLCQRDLGGSIDPSVVRDGSGALHLLWKNDGNCCGLPTSLWEQAMSPDGMHLLGTPHRLLSADQAWQQGNIEAPAMTRAAGHGWWLFYSGGSWRTADYATGVAYCAKVEGPCREVMAGPFLASTTNLRTPGGLDFFHDGQGRVWVAFTSTVAMPSRRNPRRVYMNRVMDVARLVAA